MINLTFFYIQKIFCFEKFFFSLSRAKFLVFHINTAIHSQFTLKRIKILKQQQIAIPWIQGILEVLIAIPWIQVILEVQISLPETWFVIGFKSPKSVHPCSFLWKIKNLKGCFMKSIRKKWNMLSFTVSSVEWFSYI